jgi:hypothetical protein
MITPVFGYYTLVEDTKPKRILKVPPVVILKTPPTFPKPAASATVPWIFPSLPKARGDGILFPES